MAWPSEAPRSRNGSMEMDRIFAALLTIVGSPQLVGLILLAVPIGMFFGAIPGLGGKLGIVLLIPFVFAFNPSLLIVESFEVGAFVWVIARLLAAVWMIATAFAGYDMRGRIGVVFRIARFVAGIVVLLPDPMLEIGGFAACIVLYGIDRFRRSPVKNRQASV